MLAVLIVERPFSRRNATPLSFGVRFASIRQKQLADDVSDMVAMPRFRGGADVPGSMTNLAALAERIVATLRHGPDWETPSAPERF